MANNVLYLAVGEEATRGTAESTTVGFIPLSSPTVPSAEFEDTPIADYRGEEAVKGFSSYERMSQKWSYTLETPVYTEGGTVKGIVGTLFKHFFGYSNSGQNGATGQYRHMLYPVPDPFATANLGAKGLTLNFNINESATTKNWPFVGGRVKSLSFNQEAGQHLKLSAEMFGQYRNAAGTAIASPTFAAENLRCTFNDLLIYTGNVTRTGTAPNYTDLSTSQSAFKPDKISIKIENGMEDALRLAGANYADKTRMGQYKVSMEMTIDWEDPASGFSSVDDFTSWYTAASTINFFLKWDTGTQAGTGDNHGLYIDLPVMQRMGGAPEYSRDKDPMITLKYEGLYDATTTKYIVGLLLKNTATAI